MFCPSCDNIIACSCKSCRSSRNGRGDFNSIMVIRLKGGKHKCPICEYKFGLSESVEYEWDKMVERNARIATKEHCIKWLRDKSKIESELNLDSFSIELAFFYHFKVRPNTINILEFEREYKLNKLLKN